METMFWIRPTRAFGGRRGLLTPTENRASTAN
jgi:hypothetical protein